ncbi:hypothetical protein TCAL_16214, partial [Tigriopus californicus]
MDVWDFRLIQFGQLVGLAPFGVNRGRSFLLSVRWKSRHGLYFLFTTLMSHIYFVFYIASFALLIKRKGVAYALRSSGWVGAMGIVCFFQWNLILRHEQIVSHWNSTFKVLGAKGLAKLKWKKDKKHFFILGFISFWLLPFVMICLNVCLFPGDIYIHSQLREYQINFGTSLRIYSDVFHCYSALLLCGGAFFMDTMLIYFSTGYLRKLEEINDNLLLLRPGKSGPKKIPTVYHPNIVFKTLSQELDQEMTLKAPSKAPNTSNCCLALKQLLKSHLEVQQSLELFNQRFDKVILSFPVQMFAMTLALFVGLMRGEITDDIEALTYIATGGQYLFRSYIGLLNFGKVYELGSAAKSILLRDLHIQYEKEHFDSDMPFQLESFLSTIDDDVAIKAGSYLVFNKSFILTYYGALI